MWLNSLRHLWSGSPRKTASVRRPISSRKRAARLGVEALEDRLVPATLTVNSLADLANPAAGVTTLRSALTAAINNHNTNPNSPDIINFSVNGTITLASALPAVSNEAVSIQGPGAGALTVQGDGTTVRTVTILNGGSGYTSPPTVTLTPAPAGGTTATGVAVVQNGQVVGVTITNPGFGYTAPPAVTFGGPGTGAAGLVNLAADPVLTIGAGAAVNVSGLTVDGSQNTNAGIAVAGGASLLVQDAVIQHAFNANGGGILSLGGSVRVLRSQFLNDVANSGGGAIANFGGSLDVRQSTFFNGLAGGSGGAITNSATSAGGGGTLLVLDCTFTNNATPGGRGGAIDLEPGSQATVADSTFSNNFAGHGGGALGVFSQSATLTLPSSLTLSGSTLFGNLAGPGSPGAGLYVQGSATALVRDTIVAGNQVLNGPAADVFGALDPASGYNLIGSNAGLTGISAGLNGNLIGTAAAPIDPRLAPLANNGGLTQTFALLPGSPALDHGAPDPVADGLTTTDQRGNSRVVVQPFATPPAGGDNRDIGAYELPVQTTPTLLSVNSLADANPPAGVLTLRQALQAAAGSIPLATLPAGLVSAGSPYWYEIQLAVTGTITLASALPAITSAVAIQGPGAAALTLQGDGTTVGMVTILNGGSGYTSPPTVAFSPAPAGGTTATGVAVIQNGQIVGVTLTNPGFGYTAAPAVTFSGPGTGAAGLVNLAADPVFTVGVGAEANVSGLTLDGNQAANAGIAVAGGASLLVQDAVIQHAFNANGGGILSLGGAVRVLRTQFLNDVTSGGGGAIANFGGSLDVRQFTFFNGLAGGGGGAITNSATSAGGGGTLLVLDCTFTNNATPGGRGGAIDLEPGSLATVADSTFSNNFAGHGGGALGVFSQSATLTLPSSLTLSGSTLFGNLAGRDRPALDYTCRAPPRRWSATPSWPATKCPTARRPTSSALWTPPAVTTSSATAPV
jgi:hypothetical protein